MKALFQQTVSKTKLVLLFLIALHFFLSVFGNEWGLPSRWHADEKISNVLHMVNQKTLYDPIGLFLHPTGYPLFLLIACVPVYLYLKISHYPLLEIKKAASVSWIHMANLFPEFANGIYIYARTLSALMGALTVYLIFLLGKNLYGKKEGLFSAACLSICMGIMGVNHFAKYTSLMNFFIVLTLLLCVKALNAKQSKKILTWAFLVGGFATSIHLNGPLLLLPLSLTFIFLQTPFLKHFIKTFCILMKYMAAYGIGILMGTPSLITHFSNYFALYTLKYTSEFAVVHTTAEAPRLVGLLNYFFELMSIYGIPLFSLIVTGICYSMFFWKKTSQKESVVFAFVLAYFSLIAFFLQDKYPQTKHIIAIVPPLTLFSGKIMSILSQNKKIPALIPLVCFFIIFSYSFAYCLKANLVFKKGDTRYVSTQWIRENIPPSSKIEVFDQLNYVASTTLMNDYEIMYLGRSSKHSLAKHFFKWNEFEGREPYLKFINTYDSSADYIIIDLNDINALYSPHHMEHIPGWSEYVRALFENRKHFKCVKKITPANEIIHSKKIRGFVHFENLWWNPIPSHRETSNTIYIFKRLVGS